MPRSLLRTFAICGAALTGGLIAHPVPVAAQSEARYRIETGPGAGMIEELFTDAQIALLEKLNRADVANLERLPELVVPESWGDELRYSPLARRYPSSEPWPTLLVVYLPGQVFGAYEFGRLVRWGPVSSGRRDNPTKPGTFALNWRSLGRASTVDPDWFMPWYFNFDNREGLAFHQHPLPGYPASHGCIRLLERDAQWLFGWGQTWMLDPAASRVSTAGTPVLIVGLYDFDGPPPWRSLEWLSTGIQLPPAPTPGAERRP